MNHKYVFGGVGLKLLVGIVLMFSLYGCGSTDPEERKRRIIRAKLAKACNDLGRLMDTELKNSGLEGMLGQKQNSKIHRAVKQSCRCFTKEFEEELVKKSWTPKELREMRDDQLLQLLFVGNLLSKEEKQKKIGECVQNAGDEVVQYYQLWNERIEQRLDDDTSISTLKDDDNTTQKISIKSNITSPEAIGKHIFQTIKGVHKKSLQDYQSQFIPFRDFKNYLLQNMSSSTDRQQVSSMTLADYQASKATEYQEILEKGRDYNIDWDKITYSDFIYQIDAQNGLKMYECLLLFKYNNHIYKMRATAFNINQTYFVYQLENIREI